MCRKSEKNKTPKPLLLKLFISLLLLIFMLSWNTQAFSGILKIETKTTVRISGNMMKVAITAKNNGTAAAKNVQTHLIVLGEQFKGPLVSEIKPKGFDTISFDKTFKKIRKGRYPLVVRVDFHDANQYPFSALSVMTFPYKENAHADLITSGSNIAIEKKGGLRYDIKNVGAEPKHIQANLILPKEFYTQTPKIDFKIDSGFEKILTFEISNFFALEGAIYPVFCNFEFDLNEVHYTEITRTLVSIVKKENLFRRLRWLWISLTVLLTVSFIAVIIQSHKKQQIMNN